MRLRGALLEVVLVVVGAVGTDGKLAIWKSPHARLIKLELDGKKPYGAGGGVQLYYTSRKR